MEEAAGELYRKHIHTAKIMCTQKISDFLIGAEEEVAFRSDIAKINTE